MLTRFNHKVFRGRRRGFSSRISPFHGRFVHERARSLRDDFLNLVWRLASPFLRHPRRFYCRKLILDAVNRSLLVPPHTELFVHRVVFALGSLGSWEVILNGTCDRILFGIFGVVASYFVGRKWSWNGCRWLKVPRRLSIFRRMPFRHRALLL